MPERNRFRPSVMSPQVLARGHHLPRNVRRRFRDHSILVRASTRIAAIALRSTGVVQIGHARTSDPHDVCPALRVAVESAIGAAEDVAGAPRAVSVRGNAGVSDAAASAAAARMIVRIEVSCAKRTIRQAYCNGLASDVIANTPVRSIRGDARDVPVVRPKKTSRAEALLPRRTWMKRNFCFRARRLRLCADLSSQDLDRVADGAGDCLALRPHAIQR